MTSPLAASADGSGAPVGTSATIGVHDDLAAGQSGIPVRPSDDELAGRVDVQLVVALEQGLHALRAIREDPRNENLRDILLDPGEHGGLIGIEIIVLRRHHDGLHPQGRVIIGVLNRDLALAVRTQIAHLVALPAQLGEHLEQAMAQIERQRHVVVRLPAGVTEHHPLVTGPLFLGSRPLDPLVDVGALLVDGAQDATARGIEHVLTLGVADAPDAFPGNLLDIEVGLALDLTGEHDLSRGHQRLTRHLGLGVKREEVVNQGIGNLVGHLVGVAFADGLGSEEIGHVGCVGVTKGDHPSREDANFASLIAKDGGIGPMMSWQPVK